MSSISPSPWKDPNICNNNEMIGLFVHETQLQLVTKRDVDYGDNDTDAFTSVTINGNTFYRSQSMSRIQYGSGSYYGKSYVYRWNNVWDGSSFYESVDNYGRPTSLYLGDTFPIWGTIGQPVTFSIQ